MAVKVTCPQCQAGLKLAEAPKPGKGVTCPNCRLKFVPPEPTSWVDESPSSRSYLPWVIVALLVGAGVGGVAWQQLGNKDNEPAPVVANAPSSELDKQASEQLQAKLDMKPADGGQGKPAPATNPPVPNPEPIPVVPAPAPAVPMPMPMPPAPPKGDVPDPPVPMPKKSPPKTYAETKRPMVDETPAPPPLVNNHPPAAVAENPKQKLINEAIDRGVNYLKRIQLANGSWPKQAGVNNFEFVKASYDIGLTSLGGLTLLECQVSATDPHVQRAAEYIRSTPIRDRGHRTYQMACVVLFLDRLGDPRDRDLIHDYALQLVAGQGPKGGWGYDCPDLSQTDKEQLLTFLEATHSDDTGASAKSEAKKPAAKAKPKLPPTKDISRVVGTIPIVFHAYYPNAQLPQATSNPLMTIEDNSNSQFAMMALWVARRHGIPTEKSLAFAGWRFRQSQKDDGGWDYLSGSFTMPKLAKLPNMPNMPVMPGGVGSPPAMTCVGLIGLAMGHASSLPTRAAANAKLPDHPAIAAALKVLGTHLDAQNMGNFYYLWSLERVAMLYNLKTLGNKDWYQVGVDLLLPNQREDGSWATLQNYPGNAPMLDSCFALLFLKRSNLVQDLTERLPFLMSISDPGVRAPRR